MKIEELKVRIDLFDLADRLGLKKSKAKGKDYALYHSPHHKDKNASLSIFFKDGKWGWKDHSGAGGGSCIDLVMLVRGGNEGDAVRELHEIYGWPLDKPEKAEERRELSPAEWIATKCLASTAPAVDYLVQERGISEEVARRAIQKGAVGWNTWTSAKRNPGDHGYGGPAVAFIVKSLNPGHVMAVDLRYQDAALNGGTKTQCQGEKSGYGWTSDIKRLMAAKTVYVVESPINALSIECCKLYDFAAFAVRGVGNVANIDWSWARGKQIVICFDNDDPFPPGHPMAGIRPGLKAAWELHEILTAMDISAMLVNQAEWTVNDVNDFIKPSKEFNPPGLEKLTLAMKSWEPWLIQGMAANEEERGLLTPMGKRRLYLPWHHDHVYWRYRVRNDFTSHISKVEGNKKDSDGNELPPQISYQELCGFRVAAISRVSIASATATMTGDPDTATRSMFAISVQTTRHGPVLQRKVVDDEKLHNIDTWKKFGPVFSQAPFLRMINLLENAAHIGARHAANYVGLCWREGRLIVNEGPNTYFTNPEQQCPYHNLTFPSGTAADGRRVVEAYHRTFGKNAALLPLVWGLGGHLKVMLGFWPHMQIEAKKGAGKSTIIKRLERTIGFTMFSGQSLQTEFRLLTSISSTSHPVGWEEISARRQDIIDKAVGLLQENYQYTVTRRGSDMTEYVLSAPVLLAGEDVPVKSLIGKLVRSSLEIRGPMMPDDLPRFPVRQWLEFLADVPVATARALYQDARAFCLKNSRAKADDNGAQRMVGNYAALLTAWRMITEFVGLPDDFGDFPHDLLAEMNSHIGETSSEREPWVWIMETALAQMAAGKFDAPHCWGEFNSQECLFVRSSDIMHHLASTPQLRDTYNALPIKSDRAFKKQLMESGVVSNDDVEKTINARRVGHMLAIPLSELDRFGLHAAPKTYREDVPA